MSDPIFNGVLDDQFAPGANIGVGSADYTMTASEYKEGVAWTVLGANRSGARVILPTGILQCSIWRADPANTYAVTIRCGTGTVDLDPGEAFTIITDKNGRISANALGAPVVASGWQTIDDDHTAVAGEHLDVDTTAGAIAVTLPAEPAKFDQVFISNLLGTFGTHALTVLRHPDRDPNYTIDGDAADFTAEDDGDEFSLKYDGVSNWVVIV